MFDAAFCVRRDNSSQGGYLVMLVPESTFHGTEAEYHVLDWKSSKLPRVARSSLGAEAQAAGQATDSVDFICKFWDHIQCPNLTLEQLLRRPSDLQPTMITDAKALYDSYYREGATNSIVDKRIGLEVQVMKERLQDLGGTMKWISSERQFADSLTKDATKQLLANRLRYHRIKFTWDPEYQASKKKNITDRNASRDEFSMERNQQHQGEVQPDDAGDGDVEISPEQVPVEAYVMVVNTTEVIKYVDVVADAAVPDDVENFEYDIVTSGGLMLETYCKLLMDYVTSTFRCLVLGVAWMLSYIPGANGAFVPEEGLCGLDEAPEDEEHFGTFEVLVGFIMMAIIGVSYYVGRIYGWSAGREHRLQLRHIGYERVVAEKAELEKEHEKLKSSLTQFRELSYNYGRGLTSLRDENYSITEYVWSLEETMKEKDEAIIELRDELDVLGHVLERHVHYRDEARQIMERAERAFQEHRELCPIRQPVQVARRGRVWHHLRSCQSLMHADVQELPACSWCCNRLAITPLDPVTGTTVSDDIQRWLQSVVD